MDILGVNVIQHLFQFLTPEDWYCVSLVSKNWWKEVKKFMNIRKKQFYLHLNKQEINGIFCVRPLFYLEKLGEGCDGTITGCLCLRHQEGEEVCIKCKKNTASSNCFGQFCDSKECRDYMKKYDQGKIIRVLKYSCKITGCPKPTDILKGLCYQHAETEYSLQNVKKIEVKIQCVQNTLKGERCRKQIISRIPRCSIHSKKQYSKLGK